MDKLFPIIRRKRRPLIVEDVPPIPTKNEPVQSVVTAPPVEPADEPKPDDAKSVSTSEAQ
jgi:hypothetical protein